MNSLSHLVAEFNLAAQLLIIRIASLAPPRRICRTNSLDKSDNKTKTPLFTRAVGAVGCSELLGCEDERR